MGGRRHPPYTRSARSAGSAGPAIPSPPGGSSSRAEHRVGPSAVSVRALLRSRAGAVRRGQGPLGACAASVGSEAQAQAAGSGRRRAADTAQGHSTGPWCKYRSSRHRQARQASSLAAPARRASSAPSRPAPRSGQVHRSAASEITTFVSARPGPV